MEKITLNGKPFDLVIEAEKTIGELLSGVDEWLEGTGLFLSGLEVDGKIYGALSMDEVFALSLDAAGTIDIKTSGWAELFIEALTDLKSDITIMENIPSEERQNYLCEREQGPAARFLEKNAPDIYRALMESPPSPSLLCLIDERIRELCSPVTEIREMLPASRDIVSRLEELPLDMQTGKDGRASETMLLFSNTTEKIFRLLTLVRYYGTDTRNMKESLEDFGAAVKELLSAYENRDTVLVGDLSEYELAPRLLKLTEALHEYSFSLERGMDKG
jgi:hypothetical protein